MNNISHDHLAHHFFSQMPFCELVFLFRFRVFVCLVFDLFADILRRTFVSFVCSFEDHTPYATEALKKVMGDDYNYDSTNTMRALVRNFRKCQFVEDTVRLTIA